MSAFKTFEDGYQVAIRELKRIDGVRSRARNWEVVFNGAKRRILACGSSPSKSEAEIATQAVIEEHKYLRARAAANRATPCEIIPFAKREG